MKTYGAERVFVGPGGVAARRTAPVTVMETNWLSDSCSGPLGPAVREEEVRTGPCKARGVRLMHISFPAHNR